MEGEVGLVVSGFVFVFTLCLFFEVDVESERFKKRVYSLNRYVVFDSELERDELLVSVVGGFYVIV